MSEKPTPPTEQLPGYELIACIGAGAYGEVWKATAPGGLTKAIKYVFGQLDGKRATSELKAIERIKQVRHPYLLSLERIEVIDSRLVIVTELADASLRDRYRACVQDGMPGIPRDELLRYMAESAEALDYLGNQHQLQHLDIKPENLLLLAGHIKVADFGLVKSMNDKSQSIVGGMTPLYAAPEVFQGEPGVHSDQYSLAVMYQELLTSRPPFPGTNSAELTMQHLKDEPDLSPLSEGDRFAMSRALAKAADHRFDTCVEFVNALKGTTSESAAVSFASMPTVSVSPEPHGQQTMVVTEMCSTDETADFNGGKTSISISLPEVNEPEVKSPEPPELTDQPFVESPILVLGLGGFGGQVLERFATKLAQRHSHDESSVTPSLLYIDTDQRAIQDSVRGGELTAEQTLLLALRRPQEYREKAPSMLKWLSRRWLYNVPRSLRTEGIRPLGRLALVDHARRAMQRVRSAMAIATENNKQNLRVYIVSSINGGAGSAMTTDIAYGVRSVAHKLGLTNVTTTGLMVNSSLRGADRNELTRVNAFAWLTEFQHFQRADVPYPGDAAAGLMAHTSETPFFDNTYLVDLGHGIHANQVAAGADNAAEYLLQDAMSPTRCGLDACRQASSSRRGSLRTFTLQRTEAAPELERHWVTNEVRMSLASLWCGETDSSAGDMNLTTSDTSHLVRDAATLVTRLQLDAAGLASTSRGAIEQTCGGSFTKLPGKQTLQKIADALAKGFFGEIAADLYRRVFDKSERLNGAIAAVDWYGNHFSATERQIASLNSAVDEQTQQQLADGKVLGDAQTTRASLKVSSLIVERIRQQLQAARTGLVAMTTAFNANDSDREVSIPPENSRRRQLMEKRQSEMVRVADELLASEVQSAGINLLGESADNAAALKTSLMSVIAGIVERELAGVSAPVGVVGENDCELSPGLPTLAQWGGEVRRVVAAPADCPTEHPFTQAGPAVEIAATDSAVCLIEEFDNLSLPHIASHLVGERRDYAELAKRVLTRRDVEWTSPLDESAFDTAAAKQAAPSPPAEVANFPSVAATSVLPTSVVSQD